MPPFPGTRPQQVDIEPEVLRRAAENIRRDIDQQIIDAFRGSLDDSLRARGGGLPKKEDTHFDLLAEALYGDKKK